MNKQEKVKEYSESGYNCCQSVLAAYGEDFGLDIHLSLKLAKNFGSGCVYRGEICGAVSAALMIYGLKYGSDLPNDELSSEIVYNYSRDHIKEFEKIHSSINCKDLLGLNVGFPEDLEKINEQKLFKWKCPVFIEDSVKILENNLNKSKTKKCI
ncbi:MAG: C-GCAxxG-C-C family protein [Bacteroidota bacterium]